jgi:hypothetical protein
MPSRARASSACDGAICAKELMSRASLRGRASRCPRRPCWWLGLILAASLLALWVLRPVAWILGVYGGSAGRLASRDAMLQPHRAAALTSALIAGVALVVVFASLGTLLGLVMLVAVFDVGRTLARSGLERRKEIGGLGLTFGVLIANTLQPLQHLTMPLPTVAAMLTTLAAAAIVAIWWPISRAVRPLQT